MFKKQKFTHRSTNSLLGITGERIAQAIYLRHGYSIVAANAYNARGLRWGELDLVATNDSTIVFVEVKTRSISNNKFGELHQSVSSYKMHRLIRTAKLFLLEFPQYQKLRPQIDICLIKARDLDKRQFSVTIIPNAVQDSQ